MSLENLHLDFDEAVTDFTGIFVLIVSTVSLVDSISQNISIGSNMPTFQGVLVSIFAIGFGCCLLTPEASRIFGSFRKRYSF